MNLLGTKAEDGESGVGARGRKGFEVERGARGRGMGTRRQQPGLAPNLQVRTHLWIWPAAVRSPTARDTHALSSGCCARPPGPCFLDPLCLLSPDPQLRFVELREGRAEGAD